MSSERERTERTTGATYARVQASFGPNAAQYTTSPGHSDVQALAALIERIAPPRDAHALDVGTGDDVQHFIAASTVAQAGGVARASAATAQPLTLTQDDTVDVNVRAAPATGAVTGTVTLHVFFLPPNA